MRDTLEEILRLQVEYTAENTSKMQRRGVLIRRNLPNELRELGPELRATLGAFGEDADAEGRDNTGQMSRIPWVRWYSKSRSPSATQGWYVVYLFHPDASGVSLCLSHGSTHNTAAAYVPRSDVEVAELMGWAASVLGNEVASDPSIQQGITLGSFMLARGYEKTTVFSKFYRAGALPLETQLKADLVRFMGPLAKLYRAQDEGVSPGAPSPDLLALREEVERFTAPLKVRPKGQGRGLNAAARKLVEYRAMELARQWLKDEGFDYDDVSATDSCDFRAQRAGEKWVIEVKGTTGGLGSVLLTRN